VGETAAATAREIAALRGETDRLLDEVEGRARRALEVPKQLAANPVFVGLGAVAAVAVVVALWYRSFRRAQEARRPIARLRRGAAAFGETARTRAERIRLALSDVPLEPQPTEAPSASLPEKIAGALAASATLALVDQFTRWLSKRGEVAVKQAQAKETPTRGAAPASAPAPASLPFTPVRADVVNPATPNRQPV
jgi:hypothetical protein